MPARMLRCIGQRGDIRCHRWNRLIAPQGVDISEETYKCTQCETGNAPYVPRLASERKGQMKQATAKKKK